MQYGSLVRTSRSRGPDVWLFRWSEQNYDGQRVCRKKVIGTIDDYSDCEAARRSIANLIAKVNSANRRTASDSMTGAFLLSADCGQLLAAPKSWERTRCGSYARDRRCWKD